MKRTFGVDEDNARCLRIGLHIQEGRTEEGQRHHTSIPKQNHFKTENATRCNQQAAHDASCNKALPHRRGGGNALVSERLTPHDVAHTQDTVGLDEGERMRGIGLKMVGRGA
jgi:hypothetical protein